MRTVRSRSSSAASTLPCPVAVSPERGRADAASGGWRRAAPSGRRPAPHGHRVRWDVEHLGPGAGRQAGPQVCRCPVDRLDTADPREQRGGVADGLLHEQLRLAEIAVGESHHRPQGPHVQLSEPGPTSRADSPIASSDASSSHSASTAPASSTEPSGAPVRPSVSPGAGSSTRSRAARRTARSSTPVPTSAAVRSTTAAASGVGPRPPGGRCDIGQGVDDVVRGAQTRHAIPPPRSPARRQPGGPCPPRGRSSRSPGPR